MPTMDFRASATDIIVGNTATNPSLAYDTNATGTYATGCDHAGLSITSFKDVTNLQPMGTALAGKVVTQFSFAFYLGTTIDACPGPDFTDCIFYASNTSGGTWNIVNSAVLVDAFTMGSGQIPSLMATVVCSSLPSSDPAAYDGTVFIVYIDVGGPPYTMAIGDVVLTVTYSDPVTFTRTSTTSYERDFLTKTVEPVGPSTHPKPPKRRKRTNGTP